MQKRLRHLDAFFRGARLAGIGGPEATTYIAQRQQAKAANGTINRELAMLTKTLRLAFENGKLLRLPVIRKLRESAPREGFFEREQFQEVRRRLPEDLQVAVSLAYALGWRMQSEVLSLRGAKSTSRRGRSASSPERQRTMKAAWCISRQTSRPPWCRSSTA